MKINKLDYISTLQDKSYACKRSLEVYPNNLQGQYYQVAVKRYHEILKEEMKNPIATRLAMKKVLEEHPAENLNYFNTNLETISKDTLIKPLLNKLKEKNSEHLQTYKLREELISQNHLDLLVVTPKLTKIKKILLKLKLLF